MELVRRVLALAGAGSTAPPRSAPPVGEAGSGETAAHPSDAAAAAAARGATPADPAQPMPCPSCGILLDPPPGRSRRCPRCRERIVVRRRDGRLVLLAEAAVAVFDAERARDRNETAWAAARGRWLALAATVAALPAPRARLASAPLSAASVDAARTLYLRAADRAARAARRERRWADLARIRRDQAAALHVAAGAPVPPADDVVALHREGMDATLRSVAEGGADAELVSTGCCRACAADDGVVVRVAAELRQARLPHAGCPRGLCGCDWWMATAGRGSMRRKQRRAHLVAGLAGPGRDEEAAGRVPGK